MAAFGSAGNAGGLFGERARGPESAVYQDGDPRQTSWRPYQIQQQNPGTVQEAPASRTTSAQEALLYERGAYERIRRAALSQDPHFGGSPANATRQQSIEVDITASLNRLGGPGRASAHVEE